MEKRSILRAFTQILMSVSVRFLFLVCLLFLILQGVQVAYRYGHGLMYDHAMEASPGREIALEIHEGESWKQVGERAESLGLIQNAQAFALKAKLYHSKLLPGKYTLTTAMTQVEMLDSITEEGKKNQELSDKNLVTETEDSSTEESQEEQEFGVGNENE
jgi:hypothetical protein